MTVKVKLIKTLDDKYYEVDSNGELLFNNKSAIDFGAKCAGQCYSEEGWEALSNEAPEKTKNRENITLGSEDGDGNEHATPYEHLRITFEVTGPKWLMMTLNNEQDCSTSEKSARYTKFRPENGISQLETDLYEKWLGKLIAAFSYRYEKFFDWKTIEKKAQENARYFTSVETQTRMNHTVSWVQLNRIVEFMIEFMNKPIKTPFEQMASRHYNGFVDEIARLKILDARAMSNRKERKLRIFGKKLVEPSFGDVYTTHYKGSFAHFAQAHRHRTLSYSMIMLDDFEFYVPPIIRDNTEYVVEWLTDAKKVAENFPQGQLIYINESGTLENFLLKCKERLCSAAQLEIMQQTRIILNQFVDELTFDEEYENIYHLESYLDGARCTFPDYTCASPCGFEEGIDLSRLI